ncbi:bifunctional 4-hydroxy-2-oxoglutarate aldolase/2-dehydro-3-deoxy-phosphogluconate aldolase [Gordonia sp. NPDC058843]|uniref:bifunctional 4-hydroxy-2-oxoglutarate aldolase/2-dehydro-3-deoxy-phosphogluconate aldolase n=1 Tax=Gordonia sp. NPDC058843 TaxID=3346648 RepID=UPI0036BCDE76
MNPTPSTETLRSQLAAHRLLGIVRGTDPGASVRTALTLFDEGIRIIEVSLTTVDAFAVIEEIARATDSTCLLGAGTALSRESVRRAADAGAGFILTPALSEGVDEAVELGLPVIPGALTPTEVHAAAQLGAAAVKVFPANAFPHRYIADLRQPFPGIDLLPVGGVGLEDVPRYFAHGAIGLGIGSPLCGDAPNGGDLTLLRDRARAFVAAAEASR